MGAKSFLLESKFCPFWSRTTGTFPAKPWVFWLVGDHSSGQQKWDKL